MELKIDLLRTEKKSALRVAGGVLFILLSVAWVISRQMKNQYIDVLDWIYCGILSLNGVVHIMGGFGLPLIRLFGESYLWIDDTKIAIKKSVLGKEQSISWADIKLINYKLNRFTVIRTNDTKFTLDLSKLDYAILKDAKEIIGSIANEKGIHVNL